ncbi:MAG: amino acid-binding protein [Halorhodospira halophila]|uniref:amino acid-binding protein n=1 Tax=Halorhodospira TaxID=85108 RepID=UPI001913EC1F|nr:MULTISPECIES: amino acid-binding protein [Halorhodospira]MBK5936941.1 amino acid-binding protein [Halorhodospira halophila]MBK5942386.1 amino acid-binding protein [Halorhodospira halophila]MCC3750686.1 amino acid-binding protein [Halorhodospira halophila]MCG5528170.1 amino acid-binding protein [Halorhodospira halophila]MCG5531938.1 amino acid-binding protein [Halorhodospira sp. 9621]
MKFKQLSLFLENQPAHLKQPCRILAEAGINIRTLSLADADQFGILRLIVADWERAKRVLEEAGCAVRVDEVVGLEVADECGGMAYVLEVLEQGGHNVLYTYAFTFGEPGRAVLFMRFEDPDAAIATLQAGQIHVLDPVRWLTRAD